MKCHNMPALPTCTMVVLVMCLMGSMLTGCGMISGWADSLGSKMPTSSSAARCEDSFFCFGGDEDKEAPTPHAVRKVPSGSVPNFPPPPAGHKSMPPPGPKFPPMPQSGSVPSLPYARAIPPQPGFHAGSVSRNDPRLDPGSPHYDPSVVPMPPPPPGVELEQPPEIGMGDDELKPWEAHPEWKKDLPQTPHDSIQKSIQW